MKGLHLCMGIETSFVGDGKDGQVLPKADWIDLEPGSAKLGLRDLEDAVSSCGIAQNT